MTDHPSANAMSVASTAPMTMARVLAIMAAHSFRHTGVRR